MNSPRIATPLLILHNDADPNTPFAGAVEFYLALRRLRKEVYLFNYTGEGHDLDDWANSKDFAVRMQQFFDHH
jgi:dipeptidyl aminopeptidase/acylaminoacyl peptidase